MKVFLVLGKEHDLVLQLFGFRSILYSGSAQQVGSSLNALSIDINVFKTDYKAS